MFPLLESYKKNDRIEMLMEQPFFRESEKPRETIIYLNAGLDTSNVENLNDMNFELPSVVFEKKTIEETLQNIKTEKRSIGQMLGKGPSSKKTNVKEKGIYEYRKNTLEKYSKNIRGLEGAEQFEKTGKGLKRQYDIIYYRNPDELLNNFFCYVHQNWRVILGYRAYNAFVSSLDEMLKIKVINFDQYELILNKINK